MAKRILLVDDEPLILKGLKFSLNQDGYDTDTATNGDQALEMALNNDYDIVLLDVMLPGLSGIEVCQRIREKSDVPIIMLTAKGEDMDKILGLEYGADDYMTKPFELKELEARVLVQLRNAAGKNEVFLEYRDLRIDREGKKVILCGKPLSLTAQEYRILELLLKHPQKVFTKNEIYEYAWEEYYMGEDKTINVHISNIRKKIKQVTSDEYIETVWGIGYRLHA